MTKLSVNKALLKARSLVQNGKIEEAKKLYLAVLQVFPKNKKAQQGLASLNKTNRAAETRDPPSHDISHLMNLYQNRRLEDVVKLAKVLTAQYPKAFFVWNILGASYKGLRKNFEAMDAFKKVTKLNPNYADGFNNLGLILKELGQFDEAIEAYKRAIVIKPEYAEAFNGMGNALKEKGELEKAIGAYEKSIVIQPRNAKAYYNIGVTLHEQRKLKEAIRNYEQALAVKPDLVEAHYNVGVALKEQGQLDEAIEAHRKAISIKPDYYEAFNGMGNALMEKGELEKAIEAYNNILAIEPNNETVRVQKLYQQARICDWDNIAKDRNLITKLGTTKKDVSPFAMLTLEDNPARHRTRSEIYAKANFTQKPVLKQFQKSQTPKRLKIGYFSSDFHNHATMQLMSQIFARHNRLDFEIFVYSYGRDQDDKMRRKLVNDVDHFFDVSEMDDMQMLNLARNHRLNIAIDLKGYTQDSRLETFAYGMAPVQISYLGFPGTLGTNFIDYIIADPVLIPENNRQNFSEQIIYLPDTYQPTDNTRAISNKIILRKDVGLPNDVFVFCCFNRHYKITPTEFNIWMRLLGKVEKSVLWLLKSNQWAEQNLKREAEKRGINAERLVFAEHLPNAEHLARHKLADLFLDTFNVNAHTTASDSLWAGLPMVTKLGQGFAARVAGSLLNAIGLPELITQNDAEYEALALELATHPERLAEIHSKLADNRLTEPLFDTEQYTKHLEAGYKIAYAQYISGQQPDHIFVKKF